MGLAFLHRHRLPISAPPVGTGPSWDYEEGLTSGSWEGRCLACEGELSGGRHDWVRQCPRCGWWVSNRHDFGIGPPKCTVYYQARAALFLFESVATSAMLAKVGRALKLGVLPSPGATFAEGFFPRRYWTVRSAAMLDSTPVRALVWLDEAKGATVLVGATRLEESAPSAQGQLGGPVPVAPGTADNPGARPPTEVRAGGWGLVPIKALVGMTWDKGEPTGLRVCQDLGPELDRNRKPVVNGPQRSVTMPCRAPWNALVALGIAEQNGLLDPDAPGSPLARGNLRHDYVGQDLG